MPSELVAELTGSLTSAEALLIGYLPENIGLRYVLEEGLSSRDFRSNPLQTSRGANLLTIGRRCGSIATLLRTTKGSGTPTVPLASDFIINREDSSARWTGPPKYLPLKHFKPPPTDFTVQLIFLRRDDIIKVLRFARLLPAAAATPEPPKGVTERFVYEWMKDHPPYKGEDDYAQEGTFRTGQISA